MRCVMLCDMPRADTRLEQSAQQQFGTLPVIGASRRRFDGSYSDLLRLFDALLPRFPREIYRTSTSMRSKRIFMCGFFHLLFTRRWVQANRPGPLRESCESNAAFFVTIYSCRRR